VTRVEICRPDILWWPLRCGCASKLTDSILTNLRHGGGGGVAQFTDIRMWRFRLDISKHNEVGCYMLPINEIRRKILDS
jgi:hypothetical protein